MSLFGIERWSLALAVGTAIALMLLLRVPHPPAGSNLLIVILVRQVAFFNHPNAGRCSCFSGGGADL